MNIQELDSILGDLRIHGNVGDAVEVEVHSRGDTYIFPYKITGVRLEANTSGEVTKVVLDIDDA